MNPLDIVRGQKGQYKKGHLPTYTVKGKNHSRFVHGHYGTPLYKKWMAMKRRCLNKNERSYKDYGGRGIKICNKWLSFMGFYEDMHSTFKEGLSLERINNDGDYEKSNCTWITMTEQARNKTSVQLYTYADKPLSIAELAKIANVKHRTMYARLKRYGWTLERAMSRLPR